MIRGSKYVIVNITQAICNSTYMLIINSLASRGYNSVHCPRSGSRTPYRWFVRTKRLLRSELRNPCIFGEHRIAHGVLLDLYPISRYQPYALPSGVWWSCSQLLKSYFHNLQPNLALQNWLAPDWMWFIFIDFGNPHPLHYYPSIGLV